MTKDIHKTIRYKSFIIWFGILSSCNLNLPEKNKDDSTIESKRDSTPQKEAITTHPDQTLNIDTTWDIESKKIKIKILTEKDFPKFSINDSLKKNVLLFCAKITGKDSLFFFECNWIGDTNNFTYVDGKRTERNIVELDSNNVAIGFHMALGRAMYIFNTKNNIISLTPFIDSNGSHPYLYTDGDIVFERKTQKIYNIFAWRYYRGFLYWEYKFKGNKVVFLREVKKEYKWIQ